MNGGVKTGQNQVPHCTKLHWVHFSKFLEALIKVIELVDFTILFEEEILYV